MTTQYNTVLAFILLILVSSACVESGPSLGGDEYEELRDDLSGLKSKIRKIQEIQHQVDTLRTFVSDQYAEDVGNNCITQ